LNLRPHSIHNWVKSYFYFSLPVVQLPFPSVHPWCCFLRDGGVVDVIPEDVIDGWEGEIG